MDQSMLERTVVACRYPGLSYPVSSPFDPQRSYPEYPFGTEAISTDNSVYEAVREVLREAGLDKSRFGTSAWSPLSDLVHEGATVLIKPNWVRHYHPLGLDLFSTITHPSVLRPLIDYAFRAVGPSGRIWMMDAPLYDADFARLSEVCQLDHLESTLRARGVPLRIGDLRSLIVRTDRGVVVDRVKRQTWESEAVDFDLGVDSELADLGPSLQNLFGSDYDRRVTTSFHQHIKGRQRHCFRISRRVLEADLVISVPKLKTHKKTGVSLNIKSMIGINSDKNYIPHYRVGSPSHGGDEFPDTGSVTKQLRRWAVRQARETVLGRLGYRGERVAHAFMAGLLALKEASLEKKAGHKVDPMDVFYGSIQGDSYRTGDWWGNDTCWRSALDMNKILLYGTAEGVLGDAPARRYFSVIDGVIGGEESGPLAPTPRREGILVAGWDPLSVDVVAAQIMGFKPNLIRDQRRGMQLTRHRLAESHLPIRVRSNRPEWEGSIRPGSDLGFRPHYAWKEYFEGADQ